MSEKTKFLDISPPHKIDHEELKRVRPERSSLLFNKKNFLILLLFLIFGGVFIWFKTQKTEIKVWPATETVKLEKEITLQEKALFNFASLLLPATVLEVEKTESQKFPSSFIPQQKKAEGIIKVYNLYSTSPLTLRAQTRFLSDSGKLFKAPEKISIPGKKLEKGKWLAGILDVKVVAVEDGEDYNIPPSKFSLPGLVGTNLYTLVYGESLEPMAGGSTSGGHQVLAGDLETAENVLVEKIKKANVDSLKQKADREERILLEDMISHQVIETSSSEKAGSAVKEFGFTAKVKTKVFSVKRETLEELAKELINSQISKNKTLWEKTLNLQWEIKESNLEEQKVVLTLKISAKVSEKIEKPALLDTLTGKPTSEALFLLKNQFERAEIKTTPFWLRRIPKDPKKIDLQFILD